MANPFQVNVLGGLNVGQEMRTAQAFGDQQREQDRLALQRSKMQKAMRGAIDGDADSIEEMFTLNPEMALKMEQRLVDRTARKGELANKASVQAEGEWAIKMQQALKNGDQEVLQTLIDEAESNTLIDFDQSMIGKDPNQDNLVINSMLFKWLGKDGYKALVEGKRPEKGTFSIKETPTGWVRVNSATGEVISIADDSIAAKTQRAKDKEELTAQLKSDNDIFSRSATIRNRYDKKAGDFIKVRDAYARIEASVDEPSPSGDLALIFNFMKMLDPASTVRESEFATAAGAAAVPERLKGVYLKAVEGVLMGTKQRADFVGRSEKLMKAAQKQQVKDKAEAIRIGKQWGVSEDQIFGASSQVMKFDINGNRIQ